MLTIVIYVVVTLIVAAALYALSIVVFGRSEPLPAVARGHTVTMLPEGPLTGDDLRSVRFGMSARGYTMSEVDWARSRRRRRRSTGSARDSPGRETSGSPPTGRTQNALPRPGTV